MTTRKSVSIGFTAFALLGSSIAFASIELTPEQTKSCEKTLKDAKSWDLWTWPYPLIAKLKDGSVPPECKAVIEHFAEPCTTGVKSAKSDFEALKDKNPGMTMADLCNNKAFSEMGDAYAYALQKEAFAKQQEAEKAADEQKRAEATAKVELPKATQHNASLEKAVAAAYAKDYPEGKVIKVILGPWSEDLEKDAFGRVIGHDLQATVVNKQPDGKCQLHDELWMQRGHGKSFSGPFTSRGAGSQSKTEILCSKVGGGATASAAPKKRK